MKPRNRQTAIDLAFLAFFLAIVWAILGACGVSFGQQPATYGFSSDGNGGWRAVEPIAIGNEYTPSQCGPGGCGISFGGGIGIQRYQAPQSGGGIQIRPQSEPLRFPAMCQVEGGLGCHVGHHLVLTCSHGSKGTVTYQGQRYPAQVVADSPTEGGADITILKCDAPFTMAIAILPATPPVGSEIAWQGGLARIIRVDADSLWVDQRWRLGDSGGPIWTRAGIVGVVSATRTDGTRESVGANAEACTRLLAIAWQRLGISSSVPPDSSTGGDLPSQPQESGPSDQSGGHGSPCEGLSQLQDRVETLEEFRDRMIAESSGKTLVSVVWKQQVDSRLTHVEASVDELLAASPVPGPPGPPGADGKDGQPGPPGKDATVDYDHLTAEVLKRLPSRPVQFLDGNGNVASEQIVEAGQPIQIPPQRLRTLDGDGKKFEETTAPLGEPLGLDSVFFKQ